MALTISGSSAGSGHPDRGSHRLYLESKRIQGPTQCFTYLTSKSGKKARACAPGDPAPRFSLHHPLKVFILDPDLDTDLHFCDNGSFTRAFISRFPFSASIPGGLEAASNVSAFPCAKGFDQPHFLTPTHPPSQTAVSTAANIVVFFFLSSLDVRQHMKHL